MSVNGASAGLTIELEDGVAEYMGDGIFITKQRDATAKGNPMMNTVLTRADLEKMLATV